MHLFSKSLKIGRQDLLSEEAIKYSGLIPKQLRVLSHSSPLSPWYTSWGLLPSTNATAPCWATYKSIFLECQYIKFPVTTVTATFLPLHQSFIIASDFASWENDSRLLETDRKTRPFCFAYIFKGLYNIYVFLYN